jgi:hypothetical protein
MFIVSSAPKRFCIDMSLQAQALKRICDLNAHGLLALAHGKTRKSPVSTLKEALMAMDLLCSVYPAGGGYSANSSFAFRTMPLPGLDDDNFYIADHAFLVSPTMILKGTTELTATDTVVLCTILTFNMALIHHHLGRQSGNSGTMQTAYRLYRNCIEMASSVEGIPPPRVGDALYVLHMVAMNNAAQIQYTLANFADSDQLMAHVRRSMSQLLAGDTIPEPLSSERDILAMLPRKCLQEISLNAALCTRPSTAPLA